MITYNGGKLELLENESRSSWAIFKVVLPITEMIAIPCIEKISLKKAHGNLTLLLLLLKTGVKQCQIK